jgi:hypothetical protein
MLLTSDANSSFSLFNFTIPTLEDSNSNSNPTIFIKFVTSIFLLSIEGLTFPTFHPLEPKSNYHLTFLSPFITSTTPNSVFIWIIILPTKFAFFPIHFSIQDNHLDCWLVLISWPNPTQLTFCPFTIYTTMPLANSFLINLLMGTSLFPYTIR